MNILWSSFLLFVNSMSTSRLVLYRQWVRDKRTVHEVVKSQSKIWYNILRLMKTKSELIIPPGNGSTCKELMVEQQEKPFLFRRTRNLISTLCDFTCYSRSGHKQMVSSDPNPPWGCQHHDWFGIWLRASYCFLLVLSLNNFKYTLVEQTDKLGLAWRATYSKRESCLQLEILYLDLMIYESLFIKQLLSYCHYFWKQKNKC